MIDNKCMKQKQPFIAKDDRGHFTANPDQGSKNFVREGKRGRVHFSVVLRLLVVRAPCDISPSIRSRGCGNCRSVGQIKRSLTTQPWTRVGAATAVIGLSSWDLYICDFDLYLKMFMVYIVHHTWTVSKWMSLSSSHSDRPNVVCGWIRYRL